MPMTTASMSDHVFCLIEGAAAATDPYPSPVLVKALLDDYVYN